MERLLRHLTRGWQTLVGILGDATKEGIALPLEEIQRLEQMQGVLAGVIREQRNMRENRPKN